MNIADFLNKAHPIMTSVGYKNTHLWKKNLCLLFLTPNLRTNLVTKQIFKINLIWKNWTQIMPQTFQFFKGSIEFDKSFSQWCQYCTDHKNSIDNFFWTFLVNIDRLGKITTFGIQSQFSMSKITWIFLEKSLKNINWGAHSFRAIFVISAVLVSIWKNSNRFRWPCEKLFIYFLR